MSPEARERSFDALARGLASGSLTRGKALKLMGAALVGGTLSSLGLRGVAGADPRGCKRGGKTCTRGPQCCSGECGADHKCTACAANREDCITDAECCSHICDADGVGNLTCASCRSNNNSCLDRRECCSKLCKGTKTAEDPGRCEASCIPEGAAPCDLTTGSGCPSFCTCRREADTGQGLCSVAVTGDPCTSSCDCPGDQPFCSEGVCVLACA